MPPTGPAVTGVHPIAGVDVVKSADPGTVATASPCGPELKCFP